MAGYGLMRCIEAPASGSASPAQPAPKASFISVQSGRSIRGAGRKNDVAQATKRSGNRDDNCS